jgi:hypothetical protein
VASLRACAVGDRDRPHSGSAPLGPDERRGKIRRIELRERERAAIRQA